MSIFKDSEAKIEKNNAESMAYKESHKVDAAYLSWEFSQDILVNQMSTKNHSFPIAHISHE